MEYIPDGLSKEQWAAMKKKELESGKGKDLGKVGITKFQSRSLEAWQKSGQNHLFPVDPSTPVEARPYMQRKGGSADGSDLAKIGIQGKDQAKASNKNDADLKYEKLEKEGKLKSTPFAVPWTSAEANKVFSVKKDEKVSKSSTTTPTSTNTEPKKKLFGLF